MAYKVTSIGAVAPRRYMFNVGILAYIGMRTFQSCPLGEADSAGPHVSIDSPRHLRERIGASFWDWKGSVEEASQVDVWQINPHGDYSTGWLRG